MVRGVSRPDRLTVQPSPSKHKPPILRGRRLCFWPEPAGEYRTGDSTLGGSAASLIQPREEAESEAEVCFDGFRADAFIIRCPAEDFRNNVPECSLLRRGIVSQIAVPMR